MKFIFVDGKKALLPSFCTACREPIRASYLRAAATRLTHCDCRCYYNATVPAIQSHARVS
jgi:hypothetical protein